MRIRSWQWWVAFVTVLSLLLLGAFIGGGSARRAHCKAASGDPTVVDYTGGLIVCAAPPPQ